jgi:hypothetical protein
MTSQPDKFFRDKLETFEKTAPMAAWNKIEARLEKKRNKIVWLRIAAGLALLSVASIALWTFQESSQTELANHIQVPSSTTTPKVKDADTTPETNPAPIKEQNQSKKSKAAHTTKKTIVQDTSTPLPLVAVIEPKQNQESTFAANESVVAHHSVTEEDVEAPSSRTIVYTVNEVNARFLKKVSPVEATSDEKKSSGIQKLMGLAYTIKNTETGIGDLRQKKNEILALNFRDNKQEQN